MSNLKGETVISTQVWGLLSFCNISGEGSVIYPKFNPHHNEIEKFVHQQRQLTKKVGEIPPYTLEAWSGYASELCFAHPNTCVEVEKQWRVNLIWHIMKYGYNPLFLTYSVLFFFFLILTKKWKNFFIFIFIFL